MGLRRPSIQTDASRPDRPLTVSVVIPSLNQAKYLEAAILSVVSQDYPNKECIVIDGGSSDGSVEIVRRHQDRLAHWTSEPDQGQAHAIRKGLSRSGGEVLTWLNSDDVLMPGAVGFVAEVFGAYPEIAWLTARNATMDPAGRLAEIGPPLGRFRWLIRRGGYHGRTIGGFIQQEGTFWRRELWEHAHGGLQDEKALALDFDLWRRFAAHADLVTADSILAAFRYHAGQKTDSIDRYYAELPGQVVKPPEWIRPIVRMGRSVLATLTWPLVPRVVYDRALRQWRFKPGPFFRSGIR